jgi:hypothetical protein
MCRLVLFLLFIYRSFMIVLHHIFFLHFGNAEHRVSGTLDRSRCTNSMAYSFPRFKSVRFLCRRTFRFYYLSYRSQVLGLQQRIQHGLAMICTDIENFV